MKNDWHNSVFHERENYRNYPRGTKNLREGSKTGEIEIPEGVSKVRREFLFSLFHETVGLNSSGAPRSD
jgi:hypothetical protein